MFFLPRINVSLGQFISTWNYHPLWSASNKSPYQLWTVGRHPETQTANVSDVFSDFFTISYFTIVNVPLICKMWISK